MKVSELIKNLQEIAKEYGDLDAIYSIDDEGNGFSHIYFEPCAGFYNDGEYTQYEDDDFWTDYMKVNSICIN